MRCVVKGSGRKTQACGWTGSVLRKSRQVPCSRLLSDLPDGRALATNDSPDHVRLNEDSEREVRLPGSAAHDEAPRSSGSTPASRPSTSLLTTGELSLEKRAFVLGTVQLICSTVTQRNKSSDSNTYKPGDLGKPINTPGITRK